MSGNLRRGGRLHFIGNGITVQMPSLIAAAHYLIHGVITRSNCASVAAVSKHFLVSVR